MVMAVRMVLVGSLSDPQLSWQVEQVIPVAGGDFRVERLDARVEKLPDFQRAIGVPKSAGEDGPVGRLTDVVGVVAPIH